MINFLLCQSDLTSREVRTASHAAMLLGMPIVRASLSDLPKYGKELSMGGLMPVGSVEYLKKAMLLAGLTVPESISYPEALKSHLKRTVKLIQMGDLSGICFIKPLETKAFNGFVYDPEKDITDYNDHDAEQLEVARHYPSDWRIWQSDVVNWIGEWRFYICEGEIVGHARYDSGPDLKQEPDYSLIAHMAHELSRHPNSPSGLSIDVGILAHGATSLIECNDGWSLGYYTGTLSPKDYLRLLMSRWSQIASQSSDMTKRDGAIF